MDLFGRPGERIRLLEEELRRVSGRHQLQVEELQTLLQPADLRPRLIEGHLQLGIRPPIFLLHTADPNRPLLIGNTGLVASWIAGALTLWETLRSVVRRFLNLPRQLWNFFKKLVRALLTWRRF